MSFIFPRSWLSGLTLSTAGGSTTFGVAAGQAADAGNTVIMNSATAFTKTSGAWAVGTGGGSLDTGGAPNANSWYYPYLICRLDTLATDIAISLSPTAPTFGSNIPTDYTLYRRLGAMKTNGSGNWTLFVQTGGNFLWDSPPLDVNNVNVTTTQLLSLGGVPPVPVIASLQLYFSSSVANGQATVSSPLVSIPAVATPFGNVTLYQATAGTGATALVNIPTNTAQIRAVANGTTNSFYATTYGWSDDLGKSI